MFVLGFFLDTFEIIFIMLPIFGPPLLIMLGYDPVWLGVMIGINLQTSFLTPPFGATLFYMRGVAPPEITHGRHLDGLDPLDLAAARGARRWSGRCRPWRPGCRRRYSAERRNDRFARGQSRSFRLRLCRSGQRMGRIDGWKRSCA